MNRPRKRAPSLVVLLAILGFGCQDACKGCGNAIGKEAAEEITASVDNLVNKLPELIKKIDDLIKNNIGAIDELLAHQIQEVNKLLKENIDGINAALQDTIDNVDAMLAARLDQIFKFAQGFLAQLDDIFARRINQLSYNAQALIKTLEVSGSELLEAAGFQVVRTIREGNKVVAVVVGGVVETIVLVSAALVMLAVVVLAGIFYIRQRKLAAGSPARLQMWQLGLGAGFFLVVFVVGALMVFVPSVRASVAAGRVTIAEEGVCPQVVPLAGAFVGEHRGAAAGSLAADTSQEGTKLLGGLYQCMAEGAIADLRTKAREYASAIERLIGAATRCRRNEECPAADGEHCQLSTGLCTSRCEGPQHCATGEVCHSPDTIGMCDRPCSSARPCTAGLTCNPRGECEPAGGGSGSGTGGGKGPWHIGGGLIKDLLIRKRLACPGPLCPLRVCASGCGWTDPRPDATVRPGVFEPATPADPRTRVKDVGRFFDPRLRVRATR